MAIGDARARKIWSIASGDISNVESDSNQIPTVSNQIQDATSPSLSIARLRIAIMVPYSESLKVPPI